MEVKVCAKVWLEVEGKVPLCHGKAALLSAIRKRGSIRQAARELSMSYRRAWEYIRALEAGIGAPILSTQVGGASGGGAWLTAHGSRLLELYESVYQDVSIAVATRGGTTV